MALEFKTIVQRLRERNKVSEPIGIWDKELERYTNEEGWAIGNISVVPCGDYDYRYVTFFREKDEHGSAAVQENHESE